MLKREDYDRFRVAPNDPATIRHRDVERILNKLADSSDGRLKVEKFAESVEERSIYLATLGTGPRRVLLWSQMHGDEPTHTGVMLDMFSYLLQRPALPQAREILAGCTLMYIPMLNPDGAEAVIRFNAQGIDINRDWRRQVTPEGRALLRAAKTLKPEFGFNLHNQNARTSVGRPPRPAAVSVLAPAPDASRKESPSMRVAKQMCTSFVEAVRPYAEGMISRYDDAHEPRAFGDGIQSLGVATMLVEAGGWPEADPEPMTRLHFHGMLATLDAIATDKVRQADHQVYEDLPESNSLRMNDLLLSKANVLDAKVAEPFTADVVIDHSPSERLAITTLRDGKIIEIGDLPTVTSRHTLGAEKSLIVPGQFTLVRGWKAGRPFDERRVGELLARGTTTAIGVVDLSDGNAIDEVGAPRKLPFNWCFVGEANHFDRLAAPEQVQRIALAAASGVLAIVSPSANETLWRIVHQFGLQLIKPDQLPAEAPASPQHAAQQAWSTANALKQHVRRGRINRDYAADVLFFDNAAAVKSNDPIDWSQLERVLVAGEVVWDRGKATGNTPGILLRRS